MLQNWIDMKFYIYFHCHSATNKYYPTYLFIQIPQSCKIRRPKQLQCNNYHISPKSLFIFKIIIIISDKFGKSQPKYYSIL